MNTDTVLVEINEDLYKEAGTKVDNVIQFIEQQLIVLINDDFSDELELLVQLSEKVDEIKELESELVRVRKRRMRQGNRYDFDEVLVTINRIHDNLGMIGKNQIKSIAKRNNVSYDVLLAYLKKDGGYEIVNYTGVSKK